MGKWNEKAKAANRIWRQRNPEKVKAARRRWKKKNPDKVKAWMRKWRLKNAAKTKAAFKKYYYSHQKELQAYARAYSKAHRKIITAKVTEYRRRLKAEFVERLGGQCIRCGYDKYEACFDIHHVNPKEKEKEQDWRNKKRSLKGLVLLCRNCHAEFHCVAAFDFREQPFFKKECFYEK